MNRPSLGRLANSSRRVVLNYPMLVVGLAIVSAVILLAVLGPLFVDPEGIKVGYAKPDQPPSAKYLLGTDTLGRQVLPVVMKGTLLTLRVGLIGGAIGLGAAIILGFIAGYYGGIWDHLIRGSADILLTVPGLLVLVVIASAVRGGISVNTMAFVVALLAWMWPTRTIRSQVLSLRERTFVYVARLSGMNGPEIIARELMPNLIPYLAASFVGSVAAALLASIGLEALGLGPQNEPTLGMTIYWALYYSAVLRDLWWWWAPPIVIIGLVLIGLFLASLGLDAIANPRLRKAH